MNIYKDYSKVILIFLFIYLVLLNFFQLSHQHWSSILDQDLVVIYNSLLVSSGYEQEYRGHPGYTTFFIIGIFFKFFSIFYNNFSVQQILISNNIDADLQSLFIFARVLNGFFNFFFILVLYKILKKLNLKENICIISVLLLVFYSSFYELLFVLRSELLSVLIVLISFYYLLEFIENKKKLMPVFYSGFFSCLAILAKMQAIFLIVVILFCLPFLFNYYEKKNNNILRKKYYYLINYLFLIFVLIAYVAFQLIIQFDSRFIFSKNIDVFALFFFILSYGVFLIILDKKKIINYREIISTISLFIFGFLLCVVFIKFIDLIGIIKISNEIILRLTNPIYYMSVFTPINTDSNIFVTIKDTLNLILNFNSINTFSIINILLIIASLLFNFIKKNNHLMLCLILLLGIIFISFIFNLRGRSYYSIYYIPFTIIVISIIINNFSRSALMFIYFILFLNFTGELVISRNATDTSIIRSFNRPDNIKEICNNGKANSQPYIEPIKHYFNYWTTQLDDKFLEKYCEQNKHKI